MASKTDIQVASLAAGFTIGFGFLTVWEAIKQTRQNRNPLRSAYIYMVWGEIVANLSIGIMGWLFLDGVLGPTIPVLFMLLFLWVFEIQLLMQIIINRIALIAESRKQIAYLKWGTAAVITAVNIAVFCIWIPSHLNPPVSQLFVDINKYWDRTSKVIILIVDAGLNWYFLQTVNHRLVRQHGLVKYKPLVSFNAKLMVVSIAMDVMLIGLMSLPNQVVYVQFHPVAYMVKLNIEMSMASLVVRLARNHLNDMHHSTSDGRYHMRSGAHGANGADSNGFRMDNFALSSTAKGSKTKHLESSNVGIHRRTEVEVRVEGSREGSGRTSKNFGEEQGDEVPLTNKTILVTEHAVV